MRLLRAILAVFLALMWVPMTYSCIIAAAFPEQVHAACDCGEEHEESENKHDDLPCGSGDCAPCAILESGVNLSALTPLIAPPPIFKELTQFVENLRRLAQMEIAILPEPIPAPPPIPPPAWQDDVKTALPVRGPSFVA